MPTRYQGSAAERRVLDAYIKLRRAVNSLAVRESAHLRGAGLTESQFGVLEALLHRGPTCQKDLATSILKSSGNLTTVIDNLEKRALVKRRRSTDDRRLVNVHLSAAGRRLIEDLFPSHVSVLVEAFAVLDAEEQDELAGLCRKLGGAGA